MTDTKAKIFFSYSHKDEILKDQLNTHLSILKRKDLIEDWYDRKIIPGQNWESEIDNHLFNADIVLLLISPDFIASDYCYGNELGKAIELHEANQAIVIPIIVRPVKWNGAPFAKIQALPKDAKAATTWENIDEAWMNVTEGIENAILSIAKLKSRKLQSSGLKQVSELLLKEVSRIEKVYDDTERICSGIPTGIDKLDIVIDGLHASELMVIASRPEGGASALAVNIAKNVAIETNLPVVYYSFQMSSDRLTQKLICILSELKHHDLLRGYLNIDTDTDWINLTNAIGALNNSPLYIDDSHKLSLDALILSLKEFHSKCGVLGVVVIDSLQSLLFQSDWKGSIESYSKTLKQLAKDLQTTIILTSNVSGKVELRLDKRPLIRDLDDWSVIEEDADNIIMTYIDEIYDSESSHNGTIELLVSKNSYGPLGKVLASYNKDSSIISNYEKE